MDDSGTQTWTVYNGSSPDADDYADFNSSGAMTTRYLYGLAVDQILARTSSSGTLAWYLTDNVGTVRDITNASGTVIDHIVYDSFGNITTQTNASEADRFLFAGMQYDSTTGLYYDHARYYDEAIGRFVSQDPMGFSAGDTNLYRYVGNSPASRADPCGTDWLDKYASWFPSMGLTEALSDGGFGDMFNTVYQLESNFTNKYPLVPITDPIVAAVFVIDKTVEKQFGIDTVDDGIYGVGTLSLQPPSPGNLTRSVGKLPQQFDVTPSALQRAIHQVKRNLQPSGPIKNPDVMIDITTGETYPQLPDGGVGDSIGNILDHLPP